MQVQETQHFIPRQEATYPVIRSSEGRGKAVYPGDALDIRTWVEDGKTGIALHHRRHGFVYGRLDLSYVLDDPETWCAKVGGQYESVKLIPFAVKECGCVVNLGGYVVRPCDGDSLKEETHCYKHNRVNCEWCRADIEREGEQATRLGLDDRKMIEEAQS